jgi:hypothetical protein
VVRQEGGPRGYSPLAFRIEISRTFLWNGTA